MTLRELLDDTILRLGLCDRVDLERVRVRLDMIEEDRAEMAAQSPADRTEPEDEGPLSFSSERHLTPAGGPAPYESIEIVREGGGSL